MIPEQDKEIERYIRSIVGRLNEVEFIESPSREDGVHVTFKDGSEQFVKGNFGYKLHYKWMMKAMREGSLKEARR
jgi:hypothetical protein